MSSPQKVGEHQDVDNLSGLVSRRLRQGDVSTVVAKGDDIPEHIRKLAEDNPGQVSIMQWTPTKVFSPLTAENVAAFTKYVHDEYVKLLHTTVGGESDQELRDRMKKHAPIRLYADNYERVFEKITTRDIALNPRIMTTIFYQTYLLQQVNSGKLDEQQAKGLVANAAMDTVLTEMVKRGAISQEEADDAKTKSHKK